MGEWPDGFSLSMWGMNADGEQDPSFVYGDADHNNILDRWIPSMLSDHPPEYPHLAYEFVLEKDRYQYELRPKGNQWHQILLIVLFALAPPTSGILGLWIYQRRHCRILRNRYGSSDSLEHASSTAVFDKPPRPLPKKNGAFSLQQWNTISQTSTST